LTAALQVLRASQLLTVDSLLGQKQGTPPPADSGTAADRPADRCDWSA